MDMNVRLLVHAGASSTRQDDDQHVARAAAYLDLDSTSVIKTYPIWPLSRTKGGALEVQDSSHRRNNAPQDSTSEEPDSTTFIDDTQLAYTSLESQLFPVSTRIARSTSATKRSRVAGFSSTPPVPSKAARLLESPPLHPSSPTNGDDTEHVSAETERPVATTVLAAPARRLSSQLTTKEKNQSAETTVTSNDTTSELPASYSLGDVSDGSSKRPQLSERSTSDPGPSPAKQSEVERSIVQAQNRNVIPREQQCDTTSSTHIHKSVAHGASPTRSPTGAATADSLLFNVETDQHDLSTSIEPVGPPTSIETFITHVTPTLHKLSQNPELSATFLPTNTSRNLDTHERGHWEVQCSEWDPELQRSFWKTMETVVGTGKAGWGVWCARGPESPLYPQSSQQSVEHTEQITKPSFGPVRVYCWGEVVKHIYLLLFVASSSKVRKLGLRWIDAQGLVVVQMRRG